MRATHDEGAATKRRRRLGWKIGLAGAACLALPAAVMAIDSLSVHCLAVTVDFMNGETAVASYTGAVTTPSVTLNTSVFTNTFTSVRVLLGP
jgi:hypothetical protein